MLRRTSPWASPGSRKPTSMKISSFLDDEITDALVSVASFDNSILPPDAAAGGPNGHRTAFFHRMDLNSR